MRIFVSTTVFLANALYARQTNQLSFDELNKFRKILSKSIYEETPYFEIAPMERNIYEISKYNAPGLFFYKSCDGVILCQMPEDDDHRLVGGDLLISDELLNLINDRYIEDEYKEKLTSILEEARNKFKEEVPKLKPKKDNKQTVIFSSYGFK